MGACRIGRKIGMGLYRIWIPIYKAHAKNINPQGRFMEFYISGMRVMEVVVKSAWALSVVNPNLQSPSRYSKGL